MHRHFSILPRVIQNKPDLALYVSQAWSPLSLTCSSTFSTFIASQLEKTLDLKELVEMTKEMLAALARKLLKVRTETIWLIS